jgi:multiple sugar transport system permease protein
VFALLLWGPASRVSNVTRTPLATPMMLCPVVVGISWRSLLNPQFGWINALLGAPGVTLLGDVNLAFRVLIAVDVRHG